MRLIEEADPSDDSYEALDGLLQDVHELNSALKALSERIADDVLTEIARKGDLIGLRGLFDRVDTETGMLKKSLAELLTRMGTLREAMAGGEYELMSQSGK